MSPSRRSFLASGVALSASLAGCTGRLREVGERLESEVDAPPSQGSYETGQENSSFSNETLSGAETVGADVQQSVVKVVGSEGRRGGTGWVYDDGQIVTNAHVVRQGSSYTVTTFDGETVNAERVAYVSDMQPDVGLLSAEVSAPPLSRGSVDELERGQPLLTVGHPSGIGEWLISLGRFERYEKRVNWVLSTVPASQGNSGGPLVTLDGDVIGMISGTSTMGQDQSISRSEEVFTELPEQESYTTGNPVSSVESRVAEWTS